MLYNKIDTLNTLTLIFIFERVNKKSFFENVDLLQIICAYCLINDSQNARQVEFDKLISYVKVRLFIFYVFFYNLY